MGFYTDNGIQEFVKALANNEGWARHKFKTPDNKIITSAKWVPEENTIKIDSFVCEEVRTSIVEAK